MYTYYEPQVENGMNTANLKLFKILGLFGRYDVELSFEKQVNIYIGENGLGKTTILNCLYYILKKKYVQLETIAFKSIEISFKNSEDPIVINKADIIAYNCKRSNSRISYDELFDDLYNSEIFENNSDILLYDNFEKMCREYANIQGISNSMARKQLLSKVRYIGTKKTEYAKGNEKKIQALNKALNENLSERIIYLPTYRRIENDFTNLKIRGDEPNNSEMLIRFGMSDVQKSIDAILDQIRSLSVEGFNKMAGLLLEQYKEGDNFSSDFYDVDLEIVKIVLDRLGDKIDRTTKQDIIELIKSGDINHYKYLHLANLLHRLIANYDQQKHYDDRIIGFVNTCNKYLNDKHFEYNPSNLNLRIVLNDSEMDHEPVKLTQLSSGEKQIVSLFSKLYLESDEKSIVIIDEPELSLSIKWQQLLLPDIMRSQNCIFLLTVTHSPFIFENEFDMDAQEIRACMTNQ